MIGDLQKEFQRISLRREMSSSAVMGAFGEVQKAGSRVCAVFDNRWLPCLAAYFICCLFVAVISFNAVLLYSAHLCGKSPLAFSAACAFLVGVFFLVLLRSWRGHPERVFLLVAFPAGLIFAFFLLPNQVPDECWHIYRAFDLKLTGAGTQVPAILESMPTTYAGLQAVMASQSGWGDTVFIGRDLTSYFVHLYVFPSCAIHVCALVGVNPYCAIIVGRIVNGFIFLVVGYWIVKKVPFGKVLVCVYLLNPMMIQQEFSLSADAMVNVVALAFVAYVLYLKFSESVSWSNLVGLFLLLVLTCVSKFAYAPLVLLLLLLVPRVASGKTRRLINCGAVAAVVLAVALVVAFYNGTTYSSAFELVRDPKEFLSVMLNSTIELGPLWIKEFAGMILGALNITVWEPCFWAYCLILLFSTVFNLGESKSFARWEKVFVVLLTAFMSVAILLVFREWTLTVDLRSDVIMGMQGRYLLPFYILPLLALVTPRAAQRRDNCLVLYSCGLAWIYLVAACYIVTKFML